MSIRASILAVFIAVVTFLPTEVLAAPGTIRNIKIIINDVFEGDDLSTFYSLANNIKVNTREYVIRQELLVKEGDSYDQFLVNESERALRQLSFLRRVSITPHRHGEFVDLEVEVQDTWTLFPQFSFSSGSGTDRKSLGLSEGNLLGYGKRFELLYADDEGRRKIEGVWEDRRLLGTKRRLVLGHFDRSDGFRSVVGLSQPFRTLVDEFSWQIEGNVFDLVGRLFVGGDERFIFRQKHIEAAAGYTISKGDPEVELQRYTLGYSYERDEFSEADDEDFQDVDVDPDSVSRDPALVADDREFSGPFVSYSVIATNFLSINYIDRFERVEDFSLGGQFNFRLQFAGKAFGSHEDTLLPFVRAATGWRTSPTSFLRTEFVVRSRLNNNGFDNSIFQSDSRYYDVQGIFEPWGLYLGKGTFAAALRLTYSDDLDRDKEFLLGAGNGLRGYESRTFTGESAFLLSIEERLSFAEDVYKLFNFGVAAFADVGGTSNRGIGDIWANNLYGDVGVGLRIGFPRSSGGSVLRIDFAVPLREFEEDDDEYRILVTTGQNFRAFLGNERRNRVQTESVLSPN